jgi:hypothetical protein
LNLSTPGGLLELFGILFAVIGAVLILALRGKSIKATGGITLFGVMLVILGFVVVALTPVGSVTAPPATIQTVSTATYTGPALAPGETWSSITNTLTVDVDFNYTSHAYYVCAGNDSAGATRTACVANNYVLLPLKLVRTDASNQTALFPLNVVSVPTAVGSGTVAYSFLGWKTVNSQGQWQTYWGSGTNSATTANGVVNAPSVSSNILPNGLAVSAFNSATTILHMSLAGGNSTSSYSTVASAQAAFTQYATYNVPISIGNSNPTTINIAFVVIGYTT